MKRVLVSVILVAMTVIFTASCVSTNTQSVKTGIFRDDFARLYSAYRQIGEMKQDNISRKDIELIGFNFNSPNIEHVSGVVAFRKIFGDAIFQHALEGKDAAEIKNLLHEMNQYYAYWIPFRDIKTMQDKIYFSRRNTSRSGDDLLLLFVFKQGAGDDQLIYHDYNYVKIDSKESTYSFAGGLLDAIERYGSSGANALIDAAKQSLLK